MTPTNESENFLCPLPFFQLNLHPTGRITPCCWLPKHNIGDIRESTLLEVWNGEKLRALRREFLEGKIQTCQDSMRTIACHTYAEYMRPQVREWTEVQSNVPQKLDLRLNGQCNLECIMCTVWREPNGIYDLHGFWETAETDIFPYLLEMDVLGGEPFVQRDTFRLMQRVGEVNPTCTWGFVTNGQWRFSAIIEALLDKIGIRYIIVSVDSLNPETYASIRITGKLAQTLETARKLRDYRNKRERECGGVHRFFLGISMCVQQNNWREIPDFVAFAEAEDVTPAFQFLSMPPELSLTRMSREVRSEALALCERTMERSIHRERLEAIRIPLQESLQNDPS